MISICIPVYNYDCNPLLEQLIEQTAQLFLPYEIIVFNDASKKEFVPHESTLVSIINSTENLGRNKAREELALAAKFDNLIFLDADVYLPDNKFLERYESCISNSYDIIYGGVAYSKNVPEQAYLLRWTYGSKRESRPVEKRKKDVYQNLISMGFMIKKDAFLKISTAISGNYYGHDIVFSYRINFLNYQITHIENPIIHKGLEPTLVYLYKSIEAINTTFHSERVGLIPDDFRPVQRAYLKIKKTGAIKLFIKVMDKTKAVLDKNLRSRKPKLICLDLLKLYHYSLLKQANKQTPQ
ncbi:glycosyltransferase family 2 protein [Nonlabens ulvanivorans]|uniref:glycosyltransferase family 2 protein n=1 Tax=Nonlabens ulvanivorans TaxID=906888 RepID=UPI002941DB68|nr:glycosyltransferase [Nonlabens ulvanivorans]WOI22865.1 glycosyltransferase [Nonlabens ulvanivorans]